MYGDRRRARADRADARPPLRLRGRAAGAHRQRRLRPAPARRLGRGARLGLPAHQVARPPARARLADPRAPGRGGARELARARPRHLGGARRAEALHLVEADVLGRASTAARGWRELREDSRLRDAVAARPPTRSTPTSARNGVDERGVFTQHYDTDGARRLGAADAARALPAARRPAHPRHRAGDRRRADRRRPRAALPRRGDRRRPAAARRARSRSARSGSSRRCREIGELDRARELCEKLLVATPARSASTPRRSTRARGRHLGNFPQAFTHLALINAVMHVIRAESDDSRVVSPPQPLPPAPVANPPATEDSAR